MSGGPKPPLVSNKMQLLNITDGSISLGNDTQSNLFASSAEDIAYFKTFKTYVVTFQPVVDDDEAG